MKVILLTITALAFPNIEVLGLPDRVGNHILITTLG